jgi:alkylhydroperoxidase/carboxymuconolactone decarboxylase family protein YurZ
MDEITERGLELRERLKFPSKRETKPGIETEYVEFINRYVFGEVWCREGLDPRTRSCVTVAILIAQNHMAHLELHLRAAVINGASEGELREIIFHSAVYCGAVLAADAFRVADRVFASELASV